MTDSIRSMRAMKNQMGAVFDIYDDNFERFMDNYYHLREQEGARLDFLVERCAELPELAEDDPNGGGGMSWRNDGGSGNDFGSGGYGDGGYGGGRGGGRGGRGYGGRGGGRGGYDGGRGGRGYGGRGGGGWDNNRDSRPSYGGGGNDWGNNDNFGGNWRSQGGYDSKPSYGSGNRGSYYAPNSMSSAKTSSYSTPYSNYSNSSGGGYGQKDYGGKQSY